MKRKILTSLIVVSLCLIAGGFYISSSIDRAITNLETIITLHQVEILRENLLSQLKVVQADLLLKDTPHTTQIDKLVQHVGKLDDAINICFTCHHEQETWEKLDHLRTEIGQLKKSLSRVYTVSANRERLEHEKQKAFNMGQELIEEVNAIVVASSEKLVKRTQVVLGDIGVSKWLLTSIIFTGPIVALVFAFFFLRRITASLSMLIKATRRIKEGDLSYRLHDKLHDDFQELADSFNEMASSLKDQCAKVEESQKQYKKLFESAGDAIFILEAEGENVGRIVSANQAAAKMHGYNIDELLALKIQDLDAPEAAAKISERLHRMLHGEWIIEEMKHVRKDGTVFPVAISAGLLESENKKYILAFDRDITQRKFAEEALQRTQQLVIAGEMAAGLAHEIKNPLAGIKVSIEVLSSELALAPEDKEVFLRIINEINRIETLIKNLLNYARPPKPQLSAVDVNKVLETSIKNAQITLRRPSDDIQKTKAIQIVKDLSSKLSQVMADAGQLQQIFLNLLLNAMDAIAETGTITVRTLNDSAGQVVIEISDTGTGMAEKDFANIFQPFFTTKPKGTGLGLAICKRLVEQHEGTISATTNEQGGMTFAITLPVEPASES